MIRARNQTRSGVLADRVEVAATPWSRMKGLLGRKEFPKGSGLWIRPANSIHTFFMKFPIDVVFVSESEKVIRTYEALRPFRMTTLVRGARSVLELPAGALSACPTAEGDQLVFEGNG